MKDVILLSYGNEYEWKRAIFSLLSFWSWFEGNRNEVRTIVYTDNPDHFASFLSGFEVMYEPVSLKEVEESQEATGYIYRYKISVIEKSFKKYPGHDLLFVDTDTYFKANPASLLNKIAPGQSIMYTRERTFEEAIDWAQWESTSTWDFQQYPKAFVQLVESKSFVISGEEARFNRHQSIWNSGVLGLSKEIATSMPDIFTLTDEFYLKSKWRISEQIAFTLVLDRISHILSAEEYVNHYWSFKSMIDLRLDELLTKGFSKLSLIRKVAVVKALTQKMERFLDYEQKVTNTRDSLREKDFKGALMHGVEAFKRVPLNADLVKNIKCRLSNFIP